MARKNNKKVELREELNRRDWMTLYAKGHSFMEMGEPFHML